MSPETLSRYSCFRATSHGMLLSVRPAWLTSMDRVERTARSPKLHSSFLWARLHSSGRRPNLTADSPRSWRIWDLANGACCPY